MFSFSPNTQSSHDGMIHAIKFPCYDLTYCNAASGHLRLKTTAWESTITKHLGAPVQLTRSTCLCLCSKVSNITLLAFAIE